MNIKTPALAMAAALLWASCNNKPAQPSNEENLKNLLGTIESEMKSALVEEKSKLSDESKKFYAEDRMMVPYTKAGGITVDSDYDELVSIYGKENVTNGIDHGPEGMEIQATFIYKGKPEQVVVYWEDDANRKGVSSVNVATDKSPWTTDQGIRIGTTLAELEQINGKPIAFSGFGWDYGGMVTELNGGNIPNGLGLRLVPVGNVAAKFTGDQTLKSDKVSGLDKNKVVVSEISLPLKRYE